MTESSRSGAAIDNASHRTSVENAPLEQPGRWGPYRLPKNTVVRREIVDQLCADVEARVVAVTAPAGYGKTTLLAQWVSRDTRRSAWLSIAQSDNDPMVLLDGIREALVRAGIVQDRERALSGITSYNAFPDGVARLVREIDRSTRSLLVIDGADRLESPDALSIIRELADLLPDNVVLGIGSRTDVGLSTATLRAQGVLAEVSTLDLAFTRAEIDDLAALADVSISSEDIDELLVHTEGWPIAIYLKVLEFQESDPSPEQVHVCGDDESLAHYLRSEVLGRMSAAEVSFLTRTAILDSLSGDLCSFVLDDPGARQVLESLTATQKLIFPLDQHRTWFRCHRLVRELLAADLHREAPDQEAALHARAATWYQARGDDDGAIGHAMLAGDEDLVGRLVFGAGRRRFVAGEIDTMSSWVEWFADDVRSKRHPEIALLAALAYCNTGDPGAARRWMAVAAANSGQLGALEPLFKLARAMMCPQSIDHMHTDAIAAQEGLTAASEWYAAATTMAAIATLWQGDTDAADALFATAAETGESYDAAPAAVFAHAVRSGIAADRGDRARAEALVERAMRLVREHRLERIAASVLPYVEAARCAIRRGDPASAEHLLARATALRPSLSMATPVVSVHTLLRMAQAESELANIGGARQVLREASDIVHQCGNLGPLEQRVDEMKKRIASAPLGDAGVATLTNAELRLLPLLATHLSFPEIGERLYVSRHTIKSQAMSIYRKLGASSRSEAVQIARKRYLLNDD